MELKGNVIEQQEAEQRLKRMGTIIKAMLTDMEEDNVLTDVKMEFNTFLMGEGPDNDCIISADLELRRVPVETLDQMSQLFAMQKETVNTDMFINNPYVRGMYNGMEVLMSTMDNRDARFLSETGEFYTSKRGK